MTEKKRRNRKQTMTEWIRLVATPADKAMLATITEHNGDDSESATVRRLIRLEHARLNHTATQAPAS
jgi:hypothetical protein